uniref:Uncharacterized protein n=1 Tax=Oryza rufipogon TaxID=4529 RepID=A0A0E0MVI6_ORYRU
MAATAAAAAIASSVKRATNNRRKQRRAKVQSGRQHRQRKRRLVWTDELRKMFREAFNQLSLTQNLNSYHSVLIIKIQEDYEKNTRCPQKYFKLMKLMIDPMNDLSLTRDNIASYLQKHKKRLQKEYQKRQNLLEQKDQQLPIVDNTNTSSIQQKNMHYGKYDSMNNQPLVLSESCYNEHSNKQPKLKEPTLLTANYHGLRNMHHHHKNIINMEPSNVLRPPNLNNAKGFNMPFNKEGVDEAIYQSQLMAHQVYANHVDATAQTTWEVTMTQDMRPISQVHQHGCETTPVDSSNNTNGISENNNYHVGRKNSRANMVGILWPLLR